MDLEHNLAGHASGRGALMHAMTQLTDGRLRPRTARTLSKGWIIATDAKTIRSMMDAGEPIVVVVEYRGITADGMLRHPVFRGVVEEGDE